MLKPSDDTIHADCSLALGGVRKTVKQWAAWRGTRVDFLLRKLREGVPLIDALNMTRQGRPTKPGTLCHRIRNIEARCAELWNSPCFTPPREVYFDKLREQKISERIHRLMHDVRALDIGNQDDERWSFFEWLPHGHQLSEKIKFCEGRMALIERLFSRAE